jgi:hypothetical protein
MQTKGLKLDRFTVLAMLAADWTMLLMLMAATRLMDCPSVPKSSILIDPFSERV